MPLLTHPRWASFKPSASSTNDDGAYPDLDLVPAVAIFWIASAGRVALAAFRNEAFGTVTTAAVLAVVFLPMLLLAPLRRHWLSRQRGSTATPADGENIAPVLKLVTPTQTDRAAARGSGPT
jgi:hypothetical protein